MDDNGGCAKIALVVTVVAGIIAIVIYISGFESLPELLRGERNETQFVVVTVVAPAAAAVAGSQSSQPDIPELASLPERATDTPQPTAPPPPTTAPTAPPDTPPGSILSVGETWYSGGKALQLAYFELTEYAVQDSEAVQGTWKFTNANPHPITFEVDEDGFGGVNNLGDRVHYVRFYSDYPSFYNGGTVNVAPYTSADFTVDLWVPYSNPMVNEVIVEASLGSLTGARWRVPVWH